MHNNSMAAANARYGRIIMGVYTLVNVVLLVSLVVGAWIFTGRAHHHEIAPNTTLGFRSQATLASLHGWYVAQRVGFQFVAIAATAVTAAVLATIVIAYLRGPKPLWIFAAPAIGAAVIALSFMIAGERADAAATHIETPAAPTPSMSQ
ncbi:hypothetical protein [Mycobacterium sp.]|uniref:hypothetical protein n=1 Tax=Mycobacterium sp. TaxID=1785 RepID=UPI0025EB8BC2|nr:hypothetical protein [Mycobacterium sp.]